MTRCALSPLRFATTGARRRRPLPLLSSLCASTTHATIACSLCSHRGREQCDHAFDSVSSPIDLLVCLGGFLEPRSAHQSEHDDRDHHCWWKCDPFAARGLRHGRFRLSCYGSWAVRLRMPRNTPCSRTVTVTPDTRALTQLRTVRSSLLNEVSLISRCVGALMATLAQMPGSIAIEADSVFLPFVLGWCHADLVRCFC